MYTNNLKQIKQICSAGLVLLIFVCASALAGPPARPEPSLNPSQLEQKIDARIKYWLEAIKSAKATKKIDMVRKGLAGDFSAAAGGGYAYTYALRVCELVSPLLSGGLDKGDSLKTQKELNIAIAISKMSQLAIRPALKTMASHANPAVRYYAWAGYLNIRKLILVSGSEPAGAMFELQSQAQRETSPAVLEAIFRTLNYSPQRPEDIPPSAYTQARKSAYATFAKCWAGRCKQVLDGDGQIAQACIKSAGALMRLDGAVSADKKARTNLRQMLIDMAWCAGRAYDSAQQSAAKAAQAEADEVDEKTPAEKKANPELIKYQRIISATATLLVACEKSLGTLKNIPRRPINRALSNRKESDRGAAVREAVLKWATWLKPDGVVVPTEKKFDTP